MAFSNDTLNTFLGTLERIAPTLHSIVERVIHEQTDKIGQSNTDEFGNEQVSLLMMNPKRTKRKTTYDNYQKKKRGWGIQYHAGTICLFDTKTI